ncbi:hypothetical protein EDB86DRAFT_2916897 [Lactarius hatsudake]|nr:hypothetical protein EDB86DRAFT_2916897 [Lactarius hatsudake]
MRVSLTVVPLRANLISACVSFLRSLQRTLETQPTEGRYTSPKDGWYPFTRRGSTMPTSKCMHVSASDIAILAIVRVVAVLACRKNFA